MSDGDTDPHAALWRAIAEHDRQRAPAGGPAIGEAPALARQMSASMPRSARRANALCADAVEQLKAGSWKEGEERLLQALSLAPEHVAATYALALSRWRRGAINDERAMAMVRALEPSKEQRRALAWLRHERGDRAHHPDVPRPTEPLCEPLSSHVLESIGHVRMMACHPAPGGEVLLGQTNGHVTLVKDGLPKATLEQSGWLGSIACASHGVVWVAPMHEPAIRWNPASNERTTQTITVGSKDVIAPDPGLVLSVDTPDAAIEAHHYGHAKSTQRLDATGRALDSDGMVGRLTRLADGTVVVQWTVAENAGPFAISRDGKHVVHRQQGELHVVSTAGRCVWPLPRALRWETVNVFTISDDGSWLAMRCHRDVVLMRLDTGRIMRTCTMTDDPHFAFRRDGLVVWRADDGPPRMEEWSLRFGTASWPLVAPHDRRSIEAAEARAAVLVAEVDQACEDGDLAMAQTKLDEARAMPGFERCEAIHDRAAELMRHGRWLKLRGVRLTAIGRTLGPSHLAPLTISHDGRFAATAAGTEIEGWELGALPRRRLAVDVDDTVRGLTISPDGARIVATGRRLTLVDVATGQRSVRRGGGDYKYAVAVGGNLVFTGDHCCATRWNLDGTPGWTESARGTAREVRLFGHVGVIFSNRGVQSLALDDGRELAARADLVGIAVWSQELALSTARQSGHLVLWDVRSGETVREVQLGTTLSSIALCRRDEVTLLAGVDESSHIQLWDMGKSEQLAILDGHQRRLLRPNTRIRRLRLSGDGTTMVTFSTDGMLCAWHFDWLVG